MPPEADPNTDDPGTADPGKDVEGLKAALQATRQRAQASEGRQRDLETTVAELRGRLDGLTAGAGANRPDEKPMTRAHLNQAVADEKLSQDEADAIWENHIVAKAKAEAVAEATRAVNTGTLQSKVSAELGRYQAAVPDLADKSSANFAKVKAEYDYLVANGAEQNARTELYAARAAFGSIDALETGTKPRDREPFKETGGRGEGEGGGDASGWPKNMPAASRHYYEEQIAKGMIADKAAALEEYNYKPKHKPTKRRAA